MCDFYIYINIGLSIYGDTHKSAHLLNEWLGHFQTWIFHPRNLIISNYFHIFPHNVPGKSVWWVLVGYLKWSSIWTLPPSISAAESWPQNKISTSCLFATFLPWWISWKGLGHGCFLTYVSFVSFVFGCISHLCGSFSFWKWAFLHWNGQIETNGQTSHQNLPDRNLQQNHSQAHCVRHVL